MVVKIEQAASVVDLRVGRLLMTAKMIQMSALNKKVAHRDLQIQAGTRQESPLRPRKRPIVGRPRSPGVLQVG